LFYPGHADGTTMVERRRGDTVLPARMLSGHLLRRRPALSTAEIERLAGVLLSR
jgi:hypothetical protein